MTEDKIKEILAKIGLDELECECYLALVKKSPQRAAELSRRLEVPKATMLEALYHLSDGYGIIQRVKRKNAYLFLIEDVSSLVTYLNRRVEEANQRKKVVESLLPELRSMQSFDVAKPQIYYYEGKDGMKQAFERVLEEADEIIGYGSNEDDVKYLPQLYPEYYARRVKRKIPVRAIIPAIQFNIQETLKHEVEHIRKTHLVSAEWAYPIQVNVYKGTVIFYSFEEHFALVIKSRPIADCMKKMFELAFDGAGRYDREFRIRTAL